MSSRLKALIQYIVIFGITVLLVWFSLNSLVIPADSSHTNKWDYLLHTWQNADKRWLLLMAGIIMISHVVRAVRWKMLLASSGLYTSTGSSFLSLMIGYLVNLVVPRGGEISRCYNLYKLEKIPVEVSFGTVVVERLVDVLCLLSLVALSFLLESEKLFNFINTLPIGTGESRVLTLLYIAAALLLITFILVLVFKNNASLKAWGIKVWTGFKEGLKSVFKLEKKGLFIFYSVFIWFLYFLSSYAVVQAFAETKDLGFDAMLSIFAIGSIAMAAPLPGGTGSYHVLVPQGLVFLYGIPKANAVAFVFIFHGWQTLLMILGGAISLLITSLLVKRKAEVHTSI